MRRSNIIKKSYKNYMLGFGIFDLLVSLALISIGIAAINISVLSSIKLSTESIKSLDRNFNNNSWTLNDLNSLCESETENISKCTRQREINRYQFKSK